MLEPLISPRVRHFNIAYLKNFLAFSIVFEYFSSQVDGISKFSVVRCVPFSSFTEHESKHGCPSGLYFLYNDIKEMINYKNKLFRRGFPTGSTVVEQNA